MEKRKAPTRRREAGVRLKGGKSSEAIASRSRLWHALVPRNIDEWQLQDAKAQFSEVVQRALDGHPQCVTKHGKAAVVVIAYDTLADAVRPRQNLYDFFQASPLVGADLDLDRLRGDVREVEI
jgi:prevent-host-death family protein